MKLQMDNETWGLGYPAVRHHKRDAKEVSNEVVVALITGFFSLLISLVALSLSYSSRIRALKAEEAAKQTEHIRVKALSAIEEIIYNLCRLSDVTNSMVIAIENKLFKTPEEFLAHFHPKIEEYMLGLSESHHRYRIYLTPEINAPIVNIIGELEKADLTAEYFKNRLSIITEVIDSIQSLSNIRYLSLSGEIKNS